MGAEDSKSGLPEMDLMVKNSEEAGARKLLAGMSVIPVLFAAGIALAIYTFGDTDAYSKKIALVVQYEMQYAYLAAFIFSRLVFWLNMYPMIWKARVMTKKSGNLRANMLIFREYNSDKIVVLDDGPETGRYNRANRSLHHFNENAAGIVMGFVLAAFCFPAPTLVAVCVYSVGRMMHQIGYANHGYGAHAPGFVLAMLSNIAVDGLLLLVALKGFGVQI